MCGDEEVPLDQALNIEAPLFSNILDAGAEQALDIEAPLFSNILDAGAKQEEEPEKPEKPESVQPCSKQLHRPCVACRQSRVLCDRGWPCSRCVEKGFTCTVPESVRRGRPTKAMLAEREKAEKRKR